jgi:hypothetical protein
MLTSSAVNTRIIPCHIYITTQTSFSELVKQETTGFKIEDACTATANLVYDPSKEPLVGSFKSAWFGHISGNRIFDTHKDPTSTASMQAASNRVCIKRCHYRNPGSATRHLFGAAEQLAKLSLEITCSRWGVALMGLVYDVVEKAAKEGQKAPFDVPHVRFVQTALAITDDGESFLLEEVIPLEDGTFLKYINNDRASPIHFKGQHVDQNVIGEFLSFAQHVQFTRTQKLAFVSDFQGSMPPYFNNISDICYIGGRTLLSDPQILTSRLASTDATYIMTTLLMPLLASVVSESSKVFAGGNLSAVFHDFLKEHQCNKFCRFYQLNSLQHNLEPSSSWRPSAYHPSCANTKLSPELISSSNSGPSVAP